MHSVIVGAGIAGLALAVELRRLGCDATVVESRYPGAGNSTRNVGRVRRMQLTPELTEFACRASDKWTTVDRLTGGRNPLLYPTRYVLVLYADEERAILEPMEPMWQRLGARARVVEPAAVLKAVPVLAGGAPPVGGVIGDAAIVHHDAAVYAYLLRARELGVRVRTGEGVASVDVRQGRAASVTLAGGETLRADAVVNAAGGMSAAFTRSCGIEPANAPVRREVLVTEPSRPFMTPAVTFYRPQEGWFNQTLRGELVAGVVDVDEPNGMTEEPSFRFLCRTARVLLEKAPQLAELRVVRQWAGVYDMTPDRNPLVGAYPDVANLYALNGWSGRGMLLAPLAAELLAKEIAGQPRDAALQPFDPARFHTTGGAAAVPADYYSGYNSASH
jgi:sarcosine oxidase subunit beta